MRVAAPEEVWAPFAPSRWQSPIAHTELPSVQAVEGLCASDTNAPELWAAGPTILGGTAWTIHPTAVRVQAVPGALVYAAATQLGSFSNGKPVIAVTADADGVALIDVKAGLDAGEYPIVIASPACRGTVTVLLLTDAHPIP